MKDNRDPSAIGRWLLARSDGSPGILHAADHLNVIDFADADDRRTPDEPMCGFPPGGPRPPLPTTEDPSGA